MTKLFSLVVSTACTPPPRETTDRQPGVEPCCVYVNWGPCFSPEVGTKSGSLLYAITLIVGFLILALIT